ncbi:MAG: hypothetical protein A4E45_00827 [Methanosaeta sp. PtaB.Bin039]|nr:MAG: hypothetical protein A4E45_00827 [Methanosaeta sp. PtaB.Bin039]
MFSIWELHRSSRNGGYVKRTAHHNGTHRLSERTSAFEVRQARIKAGQVRRYSYPEAGDDDFLDLAD